jgi:hypothetical protein
LGSFKSRKKIRHMSKQKDWFWAQNSGDWTQPRVYFLGLATLTLLYYDFVMVSPYINPLFWSFMVCTFLRQPRNLCVAFLKDFVPQNQDQNQDQLEEGNQLSISLVWRSLLRLVWRTLLASWRRAKGVSGAVYSKCGFPPLTCPRDFLFFLGICRMIP